MVAIETTPSRKVGDRKTVWKTKQDTLREKVCAAGWEGAERWVGAERLMELDNVSDENGVSHSLSMRLNQASPDTFSDRVIHCR